MLSWSEITFEMTSTVMSFKSIIAERNCEK
nr:MAG TPA: hypothetical protein [Caudoviricetes sp.]